MFGGKKKSKKEERPERRDSKEESKNKEKQKDKSKDKVKTKDKVKNKDKGKNKQKDSKSKDSKSKEGKSEDVGYNWLPQGKPRYSPQNLNLLHRTSSAPASTCNQPPKSQSSLYSSHNGANHSGVYGSHSGVNKSVVNVSSDTQSNLSHPFFRRQEEVQPVITESVNHYQISQGRETKHVTSINVNTKASVQLDDKCNSCGAKPPAAQHHINGTTSAAGQQVPVVVAEVNIPESVVGHKDPGRVEYADLLFNRLQRSSSHNSLADNKGTLKGILKHPKSNKRVEFNNEVDMKLFNTLSTLSRHESLESLSIFDEHAVARDHHMMQSHHQRAAPLDDTDLYMYTLRRKRCAPAKWHGPQGYGGSVAWRHQLQPWMPPNPWGGYSGCKPHYNPPTVRRVVPPVSDRHYYW